MSMSAARVTAGGTKGGSPPDGGGFWASAEVAERSRKAVVFIVLLKTRGEDERG